MAKSYQTFAFLCLILKVITHLLDPDQLLFQ